MSKYTTELRYICENLAGVDDTVLYPSVENIIDKSVMLIFDFDFPIFDEAYRKTLCTKIVKHYYTREIGEETVGLWKLRVNERMNLIMPYYNKIYEATVRVDPFKTFETTINSNRKIDTNNDSNFTNYNLFSETPQGGLEGIETGKYLTNANKATGDNNTTGNSNDDYIERRSGFNSTSSVALLDQYRKMFVDVDKLIIGELRDLFINLW